MRLGGTGLLCLGLCPRVTRTKVADQSKGQLSKALGREGAEDLEEMESGELHSNHLTSSTGYRISDSELQ